MRKAERVCSFGIEGSDAGASIVTLYGFRVQGFETMENRRGKEMETEMEAGFMRDSYGYLPSTGRAAPPIRYRTGRISGRWVGCTNYNPNIHLDITHYIP